MTYIALVLAIHMRKVTAGGTVSPLDALQALILKSFWCCDRYSFSSCLRHILLV
jgi:hypothetical protein